MHDALTHLSSRGISAPEWSKDRSRGESVRGVRGKLIGLLVNKGFHSNDVKKELAFVALVIGHAAGFVDLKAKGRSVSGTATKADLRAYHLNACHLLVDHNLVFSGKVVHVSYQVGHELPHTW